MEDEIDELKEEIRLLTKKVEILENRENKRKAYFYGKVLIKMIIIVAVVYGSYRAYEYLVNEIPNLITEKVKELNPIDLLKK